jgi:(2Fe-2S) ferredoxin
MARFERHVFVCTNKRPDGHPKGCCADKGSEELRAALKAELRSRGLNAIVRANASGCLDACEFGASMVIYPEGIWYGGVRREDVPEIVEKTIINGEVIARLRISDPRFAPGASQYPQLVIPKKIS